MRKLSKYLESISKIPHATLDICQTSISVKPKSATADEKHSLVNQEEGYILCSIFESILSAILAVVDVRTCIEIQSQKNTGKKSADESLQTLLVDVCV